TTSHSTHCAPSSAPTPHSGLTRKIPTATAMTYKTRSRGSTFTRRFYQNFVCLVAYLELANATQTIAFQRPALAIDPVELEDPAPVLPQDGLLAGVFPAGGIDGHLAAALAGKLGHARLGVDQRGDHVAQRPAIALAFARIAADLNRFDLAEFG